MAKKKTSKPIKKPNNKSQKEQSFDHTRFGSLFVAIGLIIAALLFGLLYYMREAKTHEETKRLEIFRSLASYYVYKFAEPDAGETTELIGTGLTKDDNVYLDILRTRYEEHIPISTRQERLYFQCDSPNITGGCAYAITYGDWEDTSEEYRAVYQEYLDLMEESVEKINDASTEEEKDTIRKEYREKANKLMDTIDPTWSTRLRSL